MQQIAATDLTARRARVLIGGALGITLLATLLLWWQFGTQVFIEAVVAGLSLCL